ncbi:uncharacterized protein METZ01_LOCUS205612, partial [marine metagenome]
VVVDGVFTPRVCRYGFQNFYSDFTGIKLHCLGWPSFVGTMKYYGNNRQTRGQSQMHEPFLEWNQFSIPASCTFWPDPDTQLLVVDKL